MGDFGRYLNISLKITKLSTLIVYCFNWTVFIRRLRDAVATLAKHCADVHKQIRELSLRNWSNPYDFSRILQ